MKRVLFGIGAALLLLVVVFGVGVVRAYQREAATDGYCDKLIALAKRDNVEIAGGGKSCYARAAFQADQRDPMAKAAWKCSETCIGTADSYSSLQKCENECRAKLVSANP